MTKKFQPVENLKRYFRVNKKGNPKPTSDKIKGGYSMDGNPTTGSENSVEEIGMHRLKPMRLVEKLYVSILDSNGNIIDSDNYDADLKDLSTNTRFIDGKDRMDFCIQFIYWIEHSDYLNDSTKAFLKSSYKESLRNFYARYERDAMRYNSSLKEGEKPIEVVNVNTAVSRYTADVKRIQAILDDSAYRYIFIDESNYWLTYKKRFLEQAEKFRYMSFDISLLGFEIPIQDFSTIAPSDKEYREMLSAISFYSEKSKKAVLSQVDNGCWGYLNYLIHCIPQKNKDRQNYKLLMQVVDGTYNEITRDILEQKEVQFKEMEEALRQKEEELIKRERQVSEKNNRLNERARQVREARKILDSNPQAVPNNLDFKKIDELQEKENEIIEREKKLDKAIEAYKENQRQLQEAVYRYNENAKKLKETSRQIKQSADEREEALNKREADINNAYKKKKAELLALNAVRNR
jgi:hypothetical protein